MILAGCITLIPVLWLFCYLLLLERKSACAVDYILYRRNPASCNVQPPYTKSTQNACRISMVLWHYCQNFLNFIVQLQFIHKIYIYFCDNKKECSCRLHPLQQRKSLLYPPCLYPARCGMDNFGKGNWNG